MELTSDDIKTLEQATGLRWDVFAHQKGEEVGEYFMGFQENGDCFFLKQRDGKYSCGVYESRPQLCRTYPSNPKQDELCARLAGEKKKA